MTHYDEDEEFSEEVPPTSTAIRNERKIFIGNLVQSSDFLNCFFGQSLIFADFLIFDDLSHLKLSRKI